MLSKQELTILIGKGIRMLRNQRGYSISEVSKKLEVPYQTYKRWEDGEVLPSLYNFFKICELFDVSPDDILYYGENNTGDHLGSLRKIKNFLITKPKTLELLASLIDELNNEKRLLTLLSRIISVIEEFYSDLR